MTRLTEALERAKTIEAQDGAAEPTRATAPSPTGAVEIPVTWQFDDPPAAQLAAQTEAAAEPVDAEEAFAVENARSNPFESAPVPQPFPRDVAPKLVVGEKPDHTLVEQYRHLAAALHHAQLKRGIRTVMVTSAVEAEGKTTTASNLALTLSHSHQRRVLLIDADLRRPSVHTLFQLPNKEGLGETLRSIDDERAPLIHRISPTLSVLTAGRPTQDPMSALVSESMKELMEDAAEHFDWVIVDTPPVALLSDANLLAAMVDAALLVVAANSTAYPLVRRAQESLGVDRILGVVLNRARRADLAVGYGYYYYGYSYAPKDQAPKRGLSRWFKRG